MAKFLCSRADSEIQTDKRMQLSDRTVFVSTYGPNFIFYLASSRVDIDCGTSLWLPRCLVSFSLISPKIFEFLPLQP